MRMKKKQFLVLGMGRFGTSVAKTLCAMGHEVLAVDQNQDAVDDIAPFVTQAVQADVTDEDVIASFGPSNFDAAVVSIGTNVQDSVLVSLLCKEAGVPYVIAKAMDELHGKVLRKIGVDRVIFPERDMGQRLARSLVSPGILELMDLSDDHRIAEVIVPDSWVGRTLLQLNVRRNWGVSVIAVRRQSGFTASPGADFAFCEKDILVLLGTQEQIDRIEQE